MLILRHVLQDENAARIEEVPAHGTKSDVKGSSRRNLQGSEVHAPPGQTLSSGNEETTVEQASRKQNSTGSGISTRVTEHNNPLCISAPCHDWRTSIGELDTVGMEVYFSER